MYILLKRLSATAGSSSNENYRKDLSQQRIDNTETMRKMLKHDVGPTETASTVHGCEGLPP